MDRRPHTTHEKSAAADFFLSYTAADSSWAEWIAWQLEQQHYCVVIQAWDILPGHNFIERMQNALLTAKRTLLVLSPAALRSSFVTSEWSSVLAGDPMGTHRKLIPIRVAELEQAGLLKSIVYIDLVGKSEDEARAALLSGVSMVRAKPERAPAFPESKLRPAFPPTRDSTQLPDGTPVKLRTRVVALNLIALTALVCAAVLVARELEERAPAPIPVPTTKPEFGACIADKMTALPAFQSAASDIAAAYDLATTTRSVNANECLRILNTSRDTRAFSAIQSCATAADRLLPSTFEVLVQSDPGKPVAGARVNAGGHGSCTTSGTQPCCLFLPAGSLGSGIALDVQLEGYQQARTPEAELTSQTARASRVVVSLSPQARHEKPAKPQRTTEVAVTHEHPPSVSDSSDDPQQPSVPKSCDASRIYDLEACDKLSWTKAVECRRAKKDAQRSCEERLKRASVDKP
jgi:hypothetical protein